MIVYEFYFRVCRKIKGILSFYIYCFCFKKIGRKSTIYKPDMLQGMKFISIGERTHFQQGLWILALRTDSNIKPNINIGNDVYVGRYAHIVSIKNVNICNNVLIADKVYISDNIHQYHDTSKPIKDQPILCKGSVTINEGAWLGENVCVIGASVGKNSVVAANSVVTKDVPDYTVVAGAPAKVIKKFNFDSQSWEFV
ncbi:acyltransferase [Aeromonas dhakensis]|uniref:acyltransferase n=1 Tax=Aeromonas dhakensis TaxID=196024 RepID=UPI0018E07693